MKWQSLMGVVLVGTLGYGACAAEMLRLMPRPVAVEGCATPVIDLGVTWKFNPAPASDFPSGFDTLSTGVWKEIQVPGEWVMQGFQVKAGTTAAYVRPFNVPSDWRGNRVILRCNGVYSQSAIYVNGRKVGDHLGGFLPFEFDLTDFLSTRGGNVLALAVQSESLADTVAAGSRYAQHQLGGITRRIELFCVPQAAIEAMQLDTTLSADLKQGTVELQGHVHMPDGELKKGLTVAGRLVPLGVYGAPEVAATPIDYPAAGIRDGGAFRVSLPIEHPELWHAEHPFCYRLELRLERDGKTLEMVSRNCGFRRIEIEDRQVRVNGRRVRLKGVCRHSVHPLTGRSLGDDIIRQDAELFKASNCNFVRTSHYPPEEEFLDWCDRLGLFVMDEGPVCWCNDAGSPEGWGYISRSLLRLQERDRHHPSVIIWSMANESMWNDEYRKIGEAMKQNDPSRLLFFSHSEYYGVKGRGLLDLGTRHYPNWYSVRNYDHYFRPVLFDEWCHLNAYNTPEIAGDPGIRDRWGELVDQMWTEIYQSRILPGVSIWCGVDDKFFLPGGAAVGYGPWGIIDGWRREKPEYWNVKKTFSPFRVLQKRSTITDNAVVVPVQNRYDMASLSDLRIEWNFGPVSGRVRSSLEAGQDGSLIIPLPKEAPHSGELMLSAYNSRNVLVDRDVIKVNPPEFKPLALAPTPVRLETATNAFSIISSRASVSINRHSGLFTVTTSGGNGLIQCGPFLSVSKGMGSRIKIVNGIPVYLSGTNDENAVFASVCGNWKAEAVTLVAEEENAVHIRVTGAYGATAGEYNYHITGSGMRIEYVFKDAGNGSQQGIRMDLPRDFQKLSWKRNGYWSWYPEDQIGRLTGVAKAFPHECVPDVHGPRTRPSWPWSEDTLATGANDFRSTKKNITFAELAGADDRGIRIHSDGTEHIQCWVGERAVHMQLSTHSGQGHENYFRMVANREVGPWYENPDDRYICDTVTIEFVVP